MRSNFLSINDIIRIVLAESARHQEIDRDFFRELGPVLGDKLTGLLRPFLPPHGSRRIIPALFHQFVCSLAHYLTMAQIFKPGRSNLPGQAACIELLVDNFVEANSALCLQVKP